METFFGVMDKVLEFFRMPITVYGFTFSFFDIFIVSLLLGFVVYVLRGLFS